ncbi:helix-turn-helix domain-containing protein [Pseudovibrio sp. SPO723]|uniref:winged helix-turn-helix transcriptional regulator n=1 Tax=Nesiotobacter zosterae TaxID=392721 RepID=UPI0029C5DEA8|nr:helix-turn-helix domain-containing protein [Pseudovibrio sp. SPO723]MDX5593507.1 helix-turn-helix domain-containing protein [Pseudovibrio sp. SPO723]
MQEPENPAADAFVAHCPSRGLLTRIGEKWTMLIIVALAEGPVRFGALHRRIEGVSKKMLTQSLKNLESDGLLTRKLYDEMPLRVEYTLTPKGEELVPLITALKTWAEGVVVERVRSGEIKLDPAFQEAG